MIYKQILATKYTLFACFLILLSFPSANVNSAQFLFLSDCWTLQHFHLQADGKLLVKDLMSWLITRLVGVFVGLTVCIPLLILMALKCSGRCRICTAKLYSKVQFRGHVCVLMSIFLLAAGLSILLSFNILNSVNVTIKEVRDYYLKGLTKDILQDILGEVSDFSVGTFTTQRKMQLNATVCNPTNSPFIMHSMTANGFLEGTTILEATLPRKAPHSKLMCKFSLSFQWDVLSPNSFTKYFNRFL